MRCVRSVKEGALFTAPGASISAMLRDAYSSARMVTMVITAQGNASSVTEPAGITHSYRPVSLICVAQKPTLSLITSHRAVYESMYLTK